ncbi:MAG: heavy metal translocating P-type ATPase [Sporichthyaceae bacterium]
MSGTRVLASAAGRIRIRVDWLPGRPDGPDEIAARLSAVADLRGLEVHPRTGNVVVWVSVGTDSDALAGLLRAPPPEPPAGEVALPVRHTPQAATGEIARLAVGGVVLAALAVTRLILRRPPVITGPRADTLAGVAIFTGMPFFRGALRSLTGRSGGGTNLLVTVATAASLILRQNVVALTVLWLLNIGELLQELTLRRTRRAIEDLLAVGDEQVWLVLEDGVQIEVRTETLAVDDVVAVYSHHRIAVDGVVVSGEALIDQAAITGEAVPVVAIPGSEVFAGTIVTDGSLHVRAVRVGSETVVGRIIDRVEEAAADRAPVQTVAAEFSRRFVPASFAMAALTFALTRDARRAMTMLLIACPCAAGLSTPTAISAAIGNGARRGVLIKGGAHLENAGRIDAVVLDKTGTLTVGRPLVTDVVALSERFDSDQVLALAASGEIHARHPLAQAVLRHTTERHIEIPLHTMCEVVLGMGMRADLEGNRILVGSPALMIRDGVLVTRLAEGWVTRLRAQAKTVLCVAHNGRLIGLVAVTDAIRAESPLVVEHLRGLGIRRLVMTTGDAAATAGAVADALAIAEYHAGALPEDKLALVRHLQSEGFVVGMIGDGTNDAPALAAADISMAMGSHASDVAIESADVTLAGSGLDGAATVIALSRRTMGVIRQNYGLAIGVNVLGLLAGAGGRLSPVLAAVLHNASSIAVVVNSARLVRYEPALNEANARLGLHRVPLAHDHVGLGADFPHHARPPHQRSLVVAGDVTMAP